jgi:hypothetical protein
MDTAVTTGAVPIRESGIARKEQLRAELEAVGKEPARSTHQSAVATTR